MIVVAVLANEISGLIDLHYLEPTSFSFSATELPERVIFWIFINFRGGITLEGYLRIIIRVERFSSRVFDGLSGSFRRLGLVTLLLIFENNS